MKVITYSVLRSKITEGRKDPRVSHSLSLSRSAHRSSSGLPRRRARRPGRRPHRRHRRARRLAEDLLGKRHVRPQIRVLRHNVPPWTVLLRGLEKVTGATAGINTSSRCPTMASSTFLAHQARLTTPLRLLPGDPISQFGWDLGPTLDFPRKLSAITPRHSTSSL